jgi:predicted ATP-dependent endonuclease of OLD family
MRPLAFRIKDFKSIEDSDVCYLSGDGITVLAGQNEAGKTAVLSALRDFDLEEGAAPQTQDYQPEERLDANPLVSVQFELDSREIYAAMQEENVSLPAQVLQLMEQKPTVTFWITRELKTGQFSLDELLANLWPSEDDTGSDLPVATKAESEATLEESPTGDQKEPARIMVPSEFAGWLRDYWPNFVYFDSFQDSLPRQVDFSELRASLNVQKERRDLTPRTLPGSVYDFVVMADLGLNRVDELSQQDKNLGNYLSSRGAAITGDFLTYWKQKVDKEETVDLRVKHLRDSSGVLKLAFYVHDKSDQYPDQRSKGFLWFLSFYLRLAAAQKRYPERKRLLLIDEPGSYLHARAQRDVLHLFEDRIVQRDKIIYSTHSPYLMPTYGLHRLRIVLKTTVSGTKILDRLTHPSLRGEDFADSLSPVITAIGIDIGQSLTFGKERNLFVEGMSDLLYLGAWARAFRPDLIEKFNIFPGYGATTIPLLGSLFIGWGFPFITLLDHDDQGRAVREKLIRDLLVPAARIVHPKDAKTIEDLISADDFRALLTDLDSSLSLNPSESPSTAIKRQNVDKILLARTYSERVVPGKTTMTKKSQDAITRLLTDIFDAWEK